MVLQCREGLAIGWRSGGGDHQHVYTGGPIVDQITLGDGAKLSMQMVQGLEFLELLRSTTHVPSGVGEPSSSPGSLKHWEQGRL